MKVAERIDNLNKAIGAASIAANNFESSMKGVSQAMAKIQPKKLSAHGLGREVVDHYGKLYARRKEEGIQKNVKRQKKEFRKEVIKKKLKEKKLIPKLRKKLESELTDIESSQYPNQFELRTESDGRVTAWHGQVQIPPERMRPIRPAKEIKEVKISDLQEEAEEPVPDMLNEQIVKKAQKILRRNPKLREPHINSDEFKRRVAEEIDREISQEEQRDLQEKVVLKRRRKIIRKKK